MKVLGVLLIVVALIIVIVPQFTNCEAGKDHPATLNMKTSSLTVRYASMGATDMSGGASAAQSVTVPYRMMKCLWTARAEIVAGVPVAVLGVLLLFARRKETIRVIGILTALLGVLTILIPTTIIGTCLNPEMVCNTTMKPTLFVAGGITVALGAAVLVLGERRSTDDSAQISPAA